jgi:hypothetical protein
MAKKTPAQLDQEIAAALDARLDKERDLALRNPRAVASDFPKGSKVSFVHRGHTTHGVSRGSDGGSELRLVIEDEDGLRWIVEAHKVNAETLARPPRASARRKMPTGRRGDPLSTAAGVVTDRVRASEAYRLGREEAVRAAVKAVGPSPTVALLKDLGGLTGVVRAQIARATTPGLDDNLGSPMFPLTPRSLLVREAGNLRTEVQQRLSARESG